MESEKIYLYKTSHELTQLASTLKDADNYIRRRRKCPGKALFKESINIVDDVLLKMLNRLAAVTKKEANRGK